MHRGDAVSLRAMETQTLAGRTIAVPETRELDLFAALLERRGARVLRCPLVAIRDAADPAPVLNFIRRFAEGACDDLILLTGEGLRRLLGCIDQHAPALRPQFLAQLARVRKITRGPKPARALRELGLKPDIAAEVPTTAGVIAALEPLAFSLEGRSFGVQLYGQEPNLPLSEFLQRCGAAVLTVAPYSYADSTEDAAVLELLAVIERGGIDAIAFTSTPQVRRLVAVGGEARVVRALGRTHVAAVGPVVAQALGRHGIPVQSMPEESFFLKPMTSAIEEALARAPEI
ncbi:MAG TPA: uroporphyrinogen-III synthase [Steroidobacteraceae bacterium]|jgi:uroporphyrinogen-III synthase|nr:uroporphyrinogen-III synthase [Steroidobacteraceae bacterium]